VVYLEEKIQRIADSLADYRVTLQSVLQDTHCELLCGFDSILSLLISTSEDIGQATIDDLSLESRTKNSTLQASNNVQSNDNYTSDAIPGHRPFIEPSATCIAESMEAEVSMPPDAGEKSLCRSPIVLQKTGGLDCDISTMEVTAAFGGGNIPYTYSSLESSFTRRLKRSSLEHASRIFDDPRSHPLEVFRIFRLVPCFKDRSKMYPYFRDLVTSDRGSPLEISGLPFYCIGGAGTPLRGQG
jgi:hypothetical protein